MDVPEAVTLGTATDAHMLSRAAWAAADRLVSGNETREAEKCTCDVAGHTRHLNVVGRNYPEGGLGAETYLVAGTAAGGSKLGVEDGNAAQGQAAESSAGRTGGGRAGSSGRGTAR